MKIPENAMSQDCIDLRRPILHQLLSGLQLKTLFINIRQIFEQYYHIFLLYKPPIYDI